MLYRSQSNYFWSIRFSICSYFLQIVRTEIHILIFIVLHLTSLCDDNAPIYMKNRKQQKILKSIELFLLVPGVCMKKITSECI